MANFYDTQWDKPYFTPSIAKTLLEKTPAHARDQCTYYGPNPDKKTSTPMDEGLVIDGLVLGNGPQLAVFRTKAFRTDAIKRAKANAIAAGNIVMKSADYDRCKKAADGVVGQLPKLVQQIVRSGTIKRRRFWHADGVECSTEPDVHDPYLDIVLDLKRTRVTPTESNWQRQCSKMKYGLQVAAVLEATGAKEFGWICVEADGKHRVAVHYASPTFIKTWTAMWGLLRREWGRCVKDDCFPGYISGTIEPMPYELPDGDDMTFTEE